jgi:uncharacterized protein (TIGR02757 family)
MRVFYLSPYERDRRDLFVEIMEAKEFLPRQGELFMMGFNNMNRNMHHLKDFLDYKVQQYNRPEFIEADPVQIPHLFSRKEDIEIAGFLTAVISWGNRCSILKSAKRMMSLMGNSPCDFILNYRAEHLEKAAGFVHRTFNSTDFIAFMEALRRLYGQSEGLEGIFIRHKTKDSLQPAIHQLREEFFKSRHPLRSLKHLPDPLKGSAAKRINMFLRWMIRKDDRGVDFGLWRSISPSILSCPLDIHSGNVARKLGLLTRKLNDAKAVSELDDALRNLDKEDPVRYDFALFGLGVFEGFK